jgi:hypothetical protein
MVAKFLKFCKEDLAVALFELAGLALILYKAADLAHKFLPWPLNWASAIAIDGLIIAMFFQIFMKSEPLVGKTLQFATQTVRVMFGCSVVLQALESVLAASNQAEPIFGSSLVHTGVAFFMGTLPVLAVWAIFEFRLLQRESGRATEEFEMPATVISGSQPAIVIQNTVQSLQIAPEECAIGLAARAKQLQNSGIPFSEAFVTLQSEFAGETRGSIAAAMGKRPYAVSPSRLASQNW